MTKTRPFLSMCYGDPSATEVPPCCETATKKLTFSTTSVLLLLNMPLSLSRATIFRRQKNPRRVYRPKIAGILFVCNEPEGKYYTVPDSLATNGLFTLRNRPILMNLSRGIKTPTPLYWSKHISTDLRDSRGWSIWFKKNGIPEKITSLVVVVAVVYANVKLQSKLT